MQDLCCFHSPWNHPLPQLAHGSQIDLVDDIQLLEKLLLDLSNTSYTSMERDEPRAKFQWWPCPLMLSTDTECSQYISLKTEACFYDHNDQEFQIQVNPELQQDPLYDEEVGYNWHKSWLIPSLKVKTNMSSFLISNEETIKCKVTSCYPSKKSGINFLKEVKLQGDNDQVLQEEVVTMSNLKFTSTSFKIEGNKLSLLVVVGLQSSGIILKAMISTPIYIDSRKEARLKKVPNDEKIENWKFTETLFVYNNTERIKINNDLNGFITYYSASNIRFKSKHPFYICYKFSNCFSLYYNSEATKSSTEGEVMAKVWEAIEKKQSGVIIILCKYVSLELKKRSQGIFSNWRMSFIQFVFDESEVPSQYRSIPEKSLTSAYKECSSQKKGKSAVIQPIEQPVRNMQNYFTTQIVLQQNPFHRNPSN